MSQTRSRLWCPLKPVSLLVFEYIRRGSGVWGVGVGAALVYWLSYLIVLVVGWLLGWCWCWYGSNFIVCLLYIWI
jgi:hypothetical protein